MIMSSRILYVANARVPSKRAHPYQIVQMCDAFAANGNDVSLLIPARRQTVDLEGVSIEEYYDTPIQFSYRRVRCVDLLWLLPHLPKVIHPVIFTIEVITFSTFAMFWVLRRQSNFDIIYSRSVFFTGLAAMVLPGRVIHEVHDMPESGWRTRLIWMLFRRIRGVVTISEGLKGDWQKLGPIPNLIVLPDGVQVEKFDIDMPKNQIRHELEIPLETPVVCYTGSLTPSRGIDELVEAMRLVDGELLLVGGTDKQQSELIERHDPMPENVEIEGHVRPDRVPMYLHASDVLAIVNSARSRRVARYSSALKLFEYMAACRPIVASDIPAHREIIDERMAYFFPPDDVEELAKTITDAIQDSDASKRADTARQAVTQYTWTNRAEAVTDHFVHD